MLFADSIYIGARSGVINIVCGKCSITVSVHIKALATKLRCWFSMNSIRFTREAGCYNLVCQYIYALAGDLYWGFDEKRARELFRSAGAELS